MAKSDLKQVFIRIQDVVTSTCQTGDSHFWRGLLKVRDEFLPCVSFHIRDGTQISFWEDIWLGTKSFQELYSYLYLVAYNRSDTVATVLNNVHPNLSFRRALVGQKLVEYQDLVAKISQVNLSNERDLVSWKLHRSGVFTTRSMYLFLMNQNISFHNKII